MPSTSGNSDAIAEKLFSNGNDNSSYAVNISWNAEGWLKTHKIEYFYLTVEKWPRESGGYYHDIVVQAKDGVSISWHSTSASRQSFWFRPRLVSTSLACIVMVILYGLYGPKNLQKRFIHSISEVRY